MTILNNVFDANEGYIYTKDLKFFEEEKIKEEPKPNT